MSDKRYHELHEWNESLEWKHGESLSIVPSNYRAVLVAFGVFVSFVTKAVLGDLGVLSERQRAGERTAFYHLPLRDHYPLETTKSHNKGLDRIEVRVAK